jgi:hypothetical protein
MKFKDPKSGPIIKGATSSKSIWIWSAIKYKKKYVNFIIIKLLCTNTGECISKYCTVSDDGIGSILFNDVTKSTYNYSVKAVYIKPDEIPLFKNLANNNVLDQPIYEINLKRSDFSFVVGSCRRNINFFGLSLFGTGQAGDKIYKSIANLDPLFFLSLGDQVYLDPVGSFMQAKSVDDIRKLYIKMRNYKHIRKLMSETICYEICDDHDSHCNDTNWFKRNMDATTFKNAMQVYKEFQQPDKNKKELWYTFDGNYKNLAISFFVLDTRSERDESMLKNDIKMMISCEQLVAFKFWLAQHKNDVKFICSPTPFLSQNSLDSWHGYPEQQYELLNAISKYNNVFILTGDAHCARVAKYEIEDKSSGATFQLYELLSSGLVAVNHDIGKEYDEKYNNNSLNYDKDNDFPFLIETDNILIKTVYASPTFPNPNKPITICDRVSNIWKQIVDNVFMRIEFTSKDFIAQIYNQDQILLYQKVIYLDC